MAGQDMSSADRRRIGYVAPTARRRQRSESTHADEPRSEVSGIDESRRRRHKSRRLDTSPPPKPRKPIKYGYYGQVEPGRLQLELVSCDGGEHRDQRNPTYSLGPENLLRHDKSVYCSERPSSTIILRHADDTPFSLEKLHLVGPEHGFTAPVRSGLVMVAMTMSDLQKHIDPPPHARIQGVHSPPYRRPAQRSIQPSPERLTLADALRDPELNAASDSIARERGRAADVVHDLTPGGTHYRNDFGFGRTDPEAHCEIPTPADIANDASLAEDDIDRPVTLLSDEEPGPEDTSSQEVLDYRLQRLRLMRRRYELQSFERDDRWSGLSRMPPDVAERDRTSAWNLGRLDALMARSHVYDSTSPELEGEEGPAEPSMPSNSVADRKGVEQSFEDDKVMTARFNIRRGKHKVALKFEPPVSGRFIMLKVWAGKSNVDVQSVIAMGYGGCRFFPAKSVR
ncbi:hypothetical protein LTR37_006003 [Vermiconidia calcicola]|uniref:Uncharacterized protein n=1 Tax=Vermiconidia calcicola TaxID=1690605 RepID=A0ACC3NIE9_9PEZI|nr:hypothetical protein LTR37_006003 [Vermiconidia calcicola]